MSVRIKHPKDRLKIAMILLLLSILTSCGKSDPTGILLSPTPTFIPSSQTTIPPSATPVQPTITPFPSTATPTKTMQPTPTVPSETVHFTTSDGVDLVGTLFGDGDIAVILTHMGVVGISRTSWFPFARHIASQGFTALAFDFRGWGASGGIPTRSGEPKDILAAVELLQERGYDRFVCMGASMGGMACLKTAEGSPGLFESLGILAAPFPPGDFSNLTIPKLFVFTEQDFAGRNDDFDEIYQDLPDPKELVILPGEAHGTAIFNTNEADQLTQLMQDLLEALHFPQSERTATFESHTITKNLKGAHSIDIADLDGDGILDIVGAGWNAGEIRWWQNQGDGNFIENIITESFQGVRYVLAIDLDRDGDPDLLGAAQETEVGLMWWENDGAGNFTAHAITERYKGVATVDAADLDGDGDLDIVSGTSTLNELAWWENNGTENYIKHPIPQSALQWISFVDAADLDEDGDVDIVGVGYSSDAVVWWQNDGSGSFNERIIDRNYPGGHTVRAADIDLDGDQDILGTAHTAGEFTWWQNLGKGQFEKKTILTDIPGAIFIEPGDIDGDKDIDLIGAAEISWLVIWLENDRNITFTRQDISTSFAGASCVRAADLDTDGDLDLVGAGVGGNGSILWWENLLIP